MPGGRPSLHRVWSNNHYQHVSTSWRLFALHGDSQLLSWARTAPTTTPASARCATTGCAGEPTARGSTIPAQRTKYHNPGAFWHCKGLVPWGGRDYGMDANDVDAALTGHWPDPSGLLFAWLFDANRWAKDGYELWLKNVKLPDGQRTPRNQHHAGPRDHGLRISADSRDPGGHQGHGRGADEHADPRAAARADLGAHLVVALSRDVSRRRAFNKYLIESADAVGVGVESIWSLALCATAYRITKDEKYLRQHAGTLGADRRQVFYDPAADKRWDQYGFGPGPARDGHFMLQWHRFAAALDDAKIESLAPPDEPGQYFCGVTRWDNADDIKARGGRILILSDGSSNKLTLDATTLSGGSITATSLELLSPQGQRAGQRAPIADVRGRAASEARDSALDLAGLPRRVSDSRRPGGFVYRADRQRRDRAVSRDQRPSRVPVAAQREAHRLARTQLATGQVHARLSRAVGAWKDRAHLHGHGPARRIARLAGRGGRQAARQPLSARGRIG